LPRLDSGSARRILTPDGRREPAESTLLR
jgi:hypothetical protein